MRKQGHAFHVCSGNICSIVSNIMYTHLTLPVFTIIEQVTQQNANVFFVQTSTPSSVAF